eukprot:SAG22_NODE_4314_length_1307_cov_1.635762_1_plen_358_part_10
MSGRHPPPLPVLQPPPGNMGEGLPPRSGSERPSPPPPGPWACPVCDQVNHPEAETCGLCTRGRREKLPSPPPPPPPGNLGPAAAPPPAKRPAPAPRQEQPGHHRAGPGQAQAQVPRARSAPAAEPQRQYAQQFLEQQQHMLLPQRHSQPEPRRPAPPRQSQPHSYTSPPQLYSDPNAPARLHWHMRDPLWAKVVELINTAQTLARHTEKKAQTKELVQVSEILLRRRPQLLAYFFEAVCDLQVRYRVAPHGRHGAIRSHRVLAHRLLCRPDVLRHPFLPLPSSSPLPLPLPLPNPPPVLDVSGDILYFAYYYLLASLCRLTRKRLSVALAQIHDALVHRQPRHGRAYLHRHQIPACVR